jgi:hypothetical protein
MMTLLGMLGAGLATLALSMLRAFCPNIAYFDSLRAG